VTATDKDGETGAVATATVVVTAPVVIPDAGGPYAIAEGDNLALDATGTSAGPTAVYEWDLNNDGTFGDAVGATPVLTPSDLDAFGLADGPTGPVTITLRVTEGPTVATATALYSITNVGPVATIDLPPVIHAGIEFTVKVGALDPSPTDAAAQFEYRIDWDGDGVVDLVVTGSSDPPVTHTYASVGDVGMSVVAVDKDGASSLPTAMDVAVTPAQGGGTTPTLPTTTTSPPASSGTGSGAGTGSGSGSGTSGGAVTGTSPLARTGGDAANLVMLAGALLAAGSVLTAAARPLRGARSRDRPAR
jgi:hypothetical protein